MQGFKPLYFEGKNYYLQSVLLRNEFAKLCIVKLNIIVLCSAALEQLYYFEVTLLELL